MKKVAIIVLGLLVICCLIFFAIGLVIAGKLPGLSDKYLEQKDLGITANPELIYDFYDTVGFEYNLESGQPSTGNLKYSGKLDVNRSFSQAEANAWVAAWGNDWDDMPFRNPQLLINEDGTLEGSAVLSIERAIKFAQQLGYS